MFKNALKTAPKAELNQLKKDIAQDLDKLKIAKEEWAETAQAEELEQAENAVALEEKMKAVWKQQILETQILLEYVVLSFATHSTFR